MGEVAFRKIQYGKETVRGTAVPATAAFPGTVRVPADRKPVFPEETLGLRVRSQRSEVRQILADGITLSMNGVFQKLPFLFSLGLKGGVTGSEATTGQHDYVWDFSHSLTAANNPNAATLEYGDDVQAFEIEYCMAKRYTISGKLGANAPVTVEAELFGKQITPTTFTGSLTNGAYTGMIANMTKFYVDTAWAGLGGTEKTGLLREFSVEILTGVHPRFAAAGSKMMTSHGESFLDCIATFTYEGNSDADTALDAFQAGTTRALRLSMLGPVIGTGTPHSLIIDMFGTYESVIPLANEQDGDSLHTAIFHTHSDGLATPHHFAVKVTTDSNTF